MHGTPGVLALAVLGAVGLSVSAVLVGLRAATSLSREALRAGRVFEVEVKAGSFTCRWRLGGSP
jgi:hypothetical protein